MSVNSKFGYWITVPDDNGHTKRTFQERVVPDLNKLGSTFVPAFASVKNSKHEGGQLKFGAAHEADETHFGVEIDVYGQDHNDVYRKGDLLEEILKQQRLQAEPANVRMEKPGYFVFITQREDDPELYGEKNSGEKTRK